MSEIQLLIGRRPMRSYSPGALATIAPWKSAPMDDLIPLLCSVIDNYGLLHTFLVVLVNYVSVVQTDLLTVLQLLPVVHRLYI